MGIISSTVKGQAFVVLPPALGPEIVMSVPEIDSFSVGSGAPGDVVTFFGLNFTTVSAVDFNGTPAAAFTVLSDTEMHVTVPIDFDDGPVHAANTAGTGTGPTFLSTEDVPMLGPVTAQTTTSAPGALVLAAPGAQGVYRYELRVVGQTSDLAHTKSWRLDATLQVDGVGNVTLLGVVNPLDIEPGDDLDAIASNFSAGISIQSNIPQVDVADSGGHTVNWSCKYTMPKVL